MAQSVGVLSNTTSNSENNTVSTDRVVAPGAESNTFSSASLGSRFSHGGGSVGSLSSNSATSTAATEQVSKGLRLI